MEDSEEALSLALWWDELAGLQDNVNHELWNYLVKLQWNSNLLFPNIPPWEEWVYTLIEFYATSVNS